MRPEWEEKGLCNQKNVFIGVLRCTGIRRLVSCVIPILWFSRVQESYYFNTKWKRAASFPPQWDV